MVKKFSKVLGFQLKAVSLQKVSRGFTVQEPQA